MDRRHCLRWMGSAMLLPISAFAGEKKVLPLQKSKQEWSKILSPASYKVLFEESTEPAGTSPLLDEKREGTYVCAACHQPIFKSNAKYESGSGWPSFWQPIAGAIATSTDYKVGYPRTEYHCSRCGGHLGHVFNDGPQPSGERYCNNGVALKFVASGEPLPELRK
ncbi:MAG: methionine-R-sulfoxide reductase [Proteobacteria bacterium]|nr:methionine-R-sulfoxide reductase [Pseudomonadota bacterium]